MIKSRRICSFFSLRLVYCRKCYLLVIVDRWCDQFIYYNKYQMILWNIVSPPEPSGKESKGVVSDMFVCIHHDCRIWRWIELVATVEYLKPITVWRYHREQKRQIPFGYALFVLTLSLTASCSRWVGCGSLVDWPRPEGENKTEREQISASLLGPDSHQRPNPIPHCLLWISSFQGWASRMFCGGPELPGIS